MDFISGADALVLLAQAQLAQRKELVEKCEALRRENERLTVEVAEATRDAAHVRLTLKMAVEDHVEANHRHDRALAEVERKSARLDAEYEKRVNAEIKRTHKAFEERVARAEAAAERMAMEHAEQLEQLTEALAGERATHAAVAERFRTKETGLQAKIEELESEVKELRADAVETTMFHLNRMKRSKFFGGLVTEADAAFAIQSVVAVTGGGECDHFSLEIEENEGVGV